MSTVRSKYSYLLENEPPEKTIISDGDILIKELLEKQQRTDVDLQEQLSNCKEFHKATDFLPLTSYNSGKSTLEEFQRVETHIEKINTYSSAGLDAEEIQFAVQNEIGEEYLIGKHKNLEKSLLKKRMLDIGEKIKSYEMNSSCLQVDTKNVGRHKAEFGLSIKPQSTETKLLKFALDAQQNKMIKEYDSKKFNSVKLMEAELFKHLPSKSLPSIKKIRKKARKLMRRADCSYQTDAVNNGIIESSGWDVREETKTPKSFYEPKMYTCNLQNYYTIKNGEIVQLNSNESKNTKRLDIRTKKLTQEQIRMEPRFKNYEVGTPSETLYLKNLCKYVNENNLKFLFNNFNYTSIKIMNGKMKGQGFVTFSDVTTAVEALNSINGTVINGKVVVIQFGKLRQKK